MTDAVVKDALSDIIDTNNGDIVPIHFSDGAWAEFTVSWDSNNMFHLTWNGNAWNKAGVPINRDGSPKANSNTSGYGTGNISFSGFGSTGSEWTWLMSGRALCEWSQTIIVDGEASDPFYSYAPC